mgnify:CR=1 FL=1
MVQNRSKSTVDVVSSAVSDVLWRRLFLRLSDYSMMCVFWREAPFPQTKWEFYIWTRCYRDDVSDWKNMDCRNKSLDKAGDGGCTGDFSTWWMRGGGWVVGCFKTDEVWMGFCLLQNWCEEVERVHPIQYLCLHWNNLNLIYIGPELDYSWKW